MKNLTARLSDELKNLTITVSDEVMVDEKRELTENFITLAICEERARRKVLEARRKAVNGSYSDFLRLLLYRNNLYLTYSIDDYIEALIKHTNKYLIADITGKLIERESAYDSFELENFTVEDIKKNKATLLSCIDSCFDTAIKKQFEGSLNEVQQTLLDMDVHERERAFLFYKDMLVHFDIVIEPKTCREKVELSTVEYSSFVEDNLSIDEKIALICDREDIDWDTEYKKEEEDGWGSGEEAADEPIIEFGVLEDDEDDGWGWGEKTDFPGFLEDKPTIEKSAKPKKPSKPKPKKNKAKAKGKSK